jgi:membrane peptidoglycan carboxypeptidase
VHGPHPRRSPSASQPSPPSSQPPGPPAQRRTEPDERRPRLPVQRARRGAHPSTVGWWQPPKNPLQRRQAQRKQGQRGHAPASDDTAPHREPDSTDVLPVALAPGRRLRRQSTHHRPLTAEELRSRRIRLVGVGLLGGAAAAVLGPVLAFVVGYAVFSVPDPRAALNGQVALVAYGDGSPLARLVPGEGNRIEVPIEQVPVHVRHAVLAAEDPAFYADPGEGLTSTLRIVWNQLRGGEGGGSTITQQLVEMATVGDERTPWRTYEEVILAVKISDGRTKDETLADYLNTVYFGRDAYGIQAAAQAYFGKDVQDLTTAEGALLAGLIRSPSRWDPAVNPERAVERWEVVLDGMFAQGRLTAAERAGARFPQTVPRDSLTGGAPTDSRGHIVTAVTAELAELGFTEQDVFQQGLQITTTVDPHRQQLALDAAHAAIDGQPVDLRSAMVAIDPRTGGVLAYYGGDNGLGVDYAQVRKLAGSTFKPFVVLAGLLQEPPIGLGEVFDGSTVPALRDAAGTGCDRCDLKQAMTVSNNAVFHTLAGRIGPESVVAAARAAGISAPLDHPTESIALGHKKASALEIASAYATFAAGGIWREPHLVASVATADGDVVYQAATEGERRFSQRVARNVVETMLGVARHDGLALPDGRPVAAKTGTVESRFEGATNDAWTSGFTPSLSSAVWMGTDLNSPIRTARGTPIKGNSLPGDVWQDFMSAALRDAPVEDFPPFQAIGEPPSPLRPDEDPPSPPAPQTPPTAKVLRLPPQAPPTPAASPQAPPPPPATDDSAPSPDPEEAGLRSDGPDAPSDEADDEADEPHEEGRSSTSCG